MVKLPDWTDLGQTPQVSGQMPVATYDPSAIARAGANIGKSIGAVGEAVADVGIEKNRYEYHNAHTEQVTEKIGQYDALEKDTDYATMGDRYGKAIEKINASAAAKISDPNMRERFLLDTKSDVAQFNSNVHQHALKLEGAAGNAYRAELHDTLINNAPKLPDDAERGRAINSYSGQVDTAVAKKWITPEAGVHEKKQFAEKYATSSWLAAAERDPLAARKALEDPNSLYAVIPIETRLRLRDHARMLIGTQAGEAAIAATSNDAGVPLVKNGAGGMQPVVNKPIQQATEGIISAIDPDTGEDLAPKINAAGAPKDKPSGGQLQPAIVGTPATAASLKADAYRRVIDNKDLTPQERHAALTYVNQASAAAQIASEDSARVRKETSDATLGTYLDRIAKGDFGTNGSIAREALADDKMLPTTRESLAKFAAEASGDRGQLVDYGPGWLDAKKAILSRPGTPGHIADPAEIMERALPGGDLTPAGARDLIQAMQLAHKSPDEYGLQQTKSSMQAYAKGKLSFEQDMGPIKIRDPKGEALFAAQFIPKFNAAYAKWVGEGKNPWDFLTQEKTDELLKGLRDKREMAADRMAATGDAPQAEPANAALPPAPQGLNEGGWKTLVRNPPITTKGQISRAQWGEVLNTLAADPSETTQAMFDRAYGAWGVTAKEALQKLGVGGEPQKAEPPPAATPAPAEPATPAPAPAAAKPAGPPRRAPPPTAQQAEELKADREATAATIKRLRDGIAGTAGAVKAATMRKIEELEASLDELDKRGRNPRDRGR